VAPEFREIKSQTSPSSMLFYPELSIWWCASSSINDSVLVSVFLPLLPDWRPFFSLLDQWSRYTLVLWSFPPFSFLRNSRSGATCPFESGGWDLLHAFYLRLFFSALYFMQFWKSEYPGNANMILTWDLHCRKTDPSSLYFKPEMSFSACRARTLPVKTTNLDNLIPLTTICDNIGCNSCLINY